ncbi:hypothetical protein DBR06_SOUSAS210078 [Sousa chinensis]|uniref:Uncharacterized protein n=1 Tax=Sousa chinensis TaxID=103600 RepID=A0A484GN95_SOUCH|nr:hypothetical protein DBR06_SOUSAS210078 [Sousa chinensis]
MSMAYHIDQYEVALENSAKGFLLKSH